MYLSLRAIVLLIVLSCNSLLAQSAAPPENPQSSDTLTFRTTVRRVLVDIVVRDSNNKPVHGLTAPAILS